jgi:hypothetical protein
MDKPAPKVKEPSMAKDTPERQERLAEALRANLRRRKAQARAAADQDAPGDTSELGHIAGLSHRHSREGGTP